MDKQATSSKLASTISRLYSARLLYLGLRQRNGVLRRIESIQHTKSRITLAIRSIDAATLSNAWKNLNTRINFVVRQGGDTSNN